jgi:hypothetical protein
MWVRHSLLLECYVPTPTIYHDLSYYDTNLSVFLYSYMCIYSMFKLSKNNPYSSSSFSSSPSCLLDIIEGNEIASNANELSLEQSGKLPIKPSEQEVPSMDIEHHAAVGGEKRQSGDDNMSHSNKEGTKAGQLPYEALSSTKVFSVPDTDLAPGQLTTRGFMQHITLGSIFNKAYHAFIESHIHAPEHIRIRSTNYARTIQSVAAFMLGMIPDIGSKDMPISITSYINEDEEVMHGVGLVLSSKDTAGKGDQEIVSVCQKSVNLAKEQKQSFITIASVQQRIESLFGIQAKERFITDVADSSLPKVCHNRPLPCSDKGCLVEGNALPPISLSSLSSFLCVRGRCCISIIQTILTFITIFCLIFYNSSSSYTSLAPRI